MTDTTSTGITATADAIVAQDVVDGRPGKGPQVPVTPPFPREEKKKKWWPWAAAIGGILGALGGCGAGNLITTQPVRPVFLIPPDSLVSTTPQEPTTVTKPANVVYKGPANVVFEFNCNGNPQPLSFPAQLQVGPGTFAMTPQNGNPGFTGTLSPTGLNYTASGESGTISGTLTSGNNENGTFNNKDPFYPCTGAYPMLIVLPTPINTMPTVMTGSLLTSGINGTVAINGTTSTSTSGGNGVSGGLLGAGIGVAVLGLIDLLLHPKKHKDDDDDDGDGYGYGPVVEPRWRFRDPVE